MDVKIVGFGDPVRGSAYSKDIVAILGELTGRLNRVNIAEAYLTWSAYDAPGHAAAHRWIVSAPADRAVQYDRIGPVRINVLARGYRPAVSYLRRNIALRAYRDILKDRTRAAIFRRFEIHSNSNEPAGSRWSGLLRRE